MRVSDKHAGDFFNGCDFFVIFVSERYFARVARGKIDLAAYHIGRYFDFFAVFRYLEKVDRVYRAAVENFGVFNLDAYRAFLSYVYFYRLYLAALSVRRSVSEFYLATIAEGRACKRGLIERYTRRFNVHALSVLVNVKIGQKIVTRQFGGAEIYFAVCRADFYYVSVDNVNDGFRSPRADEKVYLVIADDGRNLARYHIVGHFYFFVIKCHTEKRGEIQFFRAADVNVNVRFESRGYVRRFGDFDPEFYRRTAVRAGYDVSSGVGFKRGQIEIFGLDFGFVTVYADGKVLRVIVF